MNDLNLNEEKNAILGELDFLNCFIGLVKSFVKERKLKKILTDIQNDIFVIQATIAKPEDAFMLPNISFDRVITIQKQTYLIERDLPKINHFVIPEGSTSACFLHCVRTAIRQIERKIPGYLDNEPHIIAQYFDRVACLMFALARYENKKYKFKERPPEYFKASRTSKIQQRRSK